MKPAIVQEAVWPISSIVMVAVLPGGARPNAAGTQLRQLLRFRKYREIKLRSVFGIVVEPQKRSDLILVLASLPMVSIVEAADNA